jgi:hypothetical protein
VAAQRRATRRRQRGQEEPDSVKREKWWEWEEMMREMMMWWWWWWWMMSWCCWCRLRMIYLRDVWERLIDLNDAFKNGLLGWFISIVDLIDLMIDWFSDAWGLIY